MRVPQAQGRDPRSWRSNLYGKTRPVQIRLLQQFGANVAALKAGEQLPHSASVLREVPVEKSSKGASCSNSACSVNACGGGVAGSVDSDEFSCGACGSDATLGSDADDLPLHKGTTVVPTQPLCVCGHMLERTEQRARMIRMLDCAEPGWRALVQEQDSFLQALPGRVLITCDLCDRIATRSGACWTCANGPHTMLHPDAYDVCEPCFVLHAGVAAATAVGCDVPRSAARMKIRTESCVQAILVWCWKNLQVTRARC